MSDPQQAPKLTAQIGLGAAILLVIANMIGTGIFTTSGLLLAELNHSKALFIAWAIGALFALSGALCYGELGVMMPKAGGEYAYLREAFGDLIGFMGGWISLIVGFSAPIAATAIAVGVYLLGQDALAIGWRWQINQYDLITISPITLIAIATVLFFSYVHSRNVRWGLNIQSILTIVKLSFIILLITAPFVLNWPKASSLLQSAIHYEEGHLNKLSFAVALIYVSFAYSGWNASCYLGSEIKNPQRNLPLSILVGTIIVSIIYLLLNLSFFAVIPIESIKGAIDVAALAAHALFGPQVAKAFGIIVAICLLSAVSAMVLVGSRVYYAMAVDGLIPIRVEDKLEDKQPPKTAIYIQALITIVMILSGSFESLLIYTGFLLSLSAMLTVIALIVLRQRIGPPSRGYRTWGYPITPILFIGANL